MSDDFSAAPEKAKSKRKPRRWSVLAIEGLLVLAAVIVVFRLLTTGAILEPSLDAAKHYEWGQTYLNTGELEKAVNSFTAAINQGYDPLSMAYFQRAYTEYKLGNYKAAVDDYTRSIELDRVCDRCWIDYHNRGQAYWSLGDEEAALRDFTQATEIKSDYLSAYLARANIAIQQGNESQALLEVHTGLSKAVEDVVERGLAAGQQRSVRLEEEGQQYHFSFSANEGDEVTFAISRANVDVVILLEHDDAEPLAYDDSEGAEGGDHFTYVIEATGDYTLIVAAYYPDQMGEFTLTMDSANPDEDSARPDVARIGLGNVGSLALDNTLKIQSTLQQTFASNGVLFMEKASDQLIVYDFTDEEMGYRSLEVVGDYASALAISPDGELAALGAENILLVYDTISGSVRQTLRLGDGSPSAVAFSPDSATIVVMVQDEIQIYDSLGGSRLLTLKTNVAYGETLAFSRDGTLLAVGLDEGLVQVWNLETKSLVRTFNTGKVEEVLAVAFNPNANLLAAGGTARRLYVWDISSGDLRQTYTEHTRQINDLAFSPNGQILASASQDGSVRLWDVDEATSVLMLPHDGSVTTLEFQVDGRTLMTAADDYQLRFWRVKS